MVQNFVLHRLNKAIIAHVCDTIVQRNCVFLFGRTGDKSIANNTQLELPVFASLICVLINPWRACTARVTVVVLSVCVCLSMHILALQAMRQPVSDNNGFQTTRP